MLSALAAAAAPRSFSTWAKEGRADVKYVKCAACEAAIAELHKQVAKARAGGSTSEEAIHAQIEAVCKPESDGGAWLRAVDLVEEGDAAVARRGVQRRPAVELRWIASRERTL